MNEMHCYCTNNETTTIVQSISMSQVWVNWYACHQRLRGRVAHKFLGAEKCWATYISQSKKCQSKQAVHFVKHNL